MPLYKLTVAEAQSLFRFNYEFFDDDMFDKFVDFFWSNYKEN